jgi:hypothetical protein
MRDFHDLLKEKSSFLLMMLGWSSMSFAALMLQFIPLISQLLGQNTGVVQFDTMAQFLTGFSHRRILKMVDTDVLVMFFDPHLSQILCLSDARFQTHLQGMLYMPGIFRDRSSFTGQRIVESFLGGRPTVLMSGLDRTLLM